MTPLFSFLTVLLLNNSFYFGVLCVLSYLRWPITTLFISNFSCRYRSRCSCCSCFLIATILFLAFLCVLSTAKLSRLFYFRSVLMPLPLVPCCCPFWVLFLFFYRCRCCLCSSFAFCFYPLRGVLVLDCFLFLRCRCCFVS